MIIWLLVGIVLLVATVVLVVVVGSALPKRHSVARMAHFNRSPKEMWDVLTDFADQPSWRSDVRSVERLPDRNGRPVWRETDKRGQPLTLETMESVAARRLVRRIADENLSYGGSWTIEIGHYGEVTGLTITEDGEVHNPIFRFMSRFIIGQTSTIDEYLRALGRKLGVEVTITSG